MAYQCVAFWEAVAACIHVVDDSVFHSRPEGEASYVERGGSFAVVRLHKAMSSAEDFMTQVAVLFMVYVVMIVRNRGEIVKFHLAPIWNDGDERLVQSGVIGNNHWITPLHQFA
jgi:hypothetical protein